MFYFQNINGKKVLKSDFIKTEHFFTTREFCIKSKEPENIDIINQNKRDLCQYLRISESNLISPSQTHTSNVVVANSDIKSLNQDQQAIPFEVTGGTESTLQVFYDDKKNVGAVSHAGWRGTAGNIATKTIEKLVSEFGSKRENISAAIGPAISMCCYNVGEEVYTKLKSTVNDFSGMYEIREGEIFVDLKKINAKQIEECGVRNIDIAPYCTCCNNELFYSYRKENATTNRHSAVLKLN